MGMTMTVIRRGALLLVLALVVVAAAAAAPARLRVMPTTQFTVQGTGFHPGEHVTVAVQAEDEGASKRVTAGTGGGFVVRFPGVQAGSCPGFRVRATGDKGTRALLSVRAPECPQPKQP
jgi:predicted RNA-binding protein with TRAM domain